MTHRLLNGSQDAALDVSNGLCVNRGQFVHQAVVERQQGQVEEEALSHCVLSPWSSNLCRHPPRGGGGNPRMFNGTLTFSSDSTSASKSNNSTKKKLVANWGQQLVKMFIVKFI